MDEERAEGNDPLVVTMIYRNHRGEIAKRRISPIRVIYAATEWHPEGWLLEAYDFDKEAKRLFALADCDFRMVSAETGAAQADLRDKFAMAAVGGILGGYWANPEILGIKLGDFASEAYQIADAMIRARGAPDE